MSDRIICKAYGKVNLGLDVVGVLENGYHEVNMIMQTVDVFDTLHLAKCQEEGIRIVADTENIPCDQNNLAYKAAALLFEKYRIKGGLEIKIEKQIPIAAGMAGGSADCAAVLRGVNQLYELNLSILDLEKEAVKLGADVPYCLTGGTMLAQGIGEILEKVESPPKCSVVIAKPNLFISTKYVYDHLNLDQVVHPDIQEMQVALEECDLDKMCQHMGNVLESVTGSENSIIGEIEKIMEDGGALRAMMSGSGPTVFGIFKDKENAEAVAKKIKEKNLTQEVFLTDFVQPGKEQL